MNTIKDNFLVSVKLYGGTDLMHRKHDEVGAQTTWASHRNYSFALSQKVSKSLVATNWCSLQFAQLYN